MPTQTGLFNTDMTLRVAQPRGRAKSTGGGKPHYNPVPAAKKRKPNGQAKRDARQISIIRSSVDILTSRMEAAILAELREPSGEYRLAATDSRGNPTSLNSVELTDFLCDHFSPKPIKIEKKTDEPTTDYNRRLSAAKDKQYQLMSTYDTAVERIWAKAFDIPLVADSDGVSVFDVDHVCWPFDQLGNW